MSSLFARAARYASLTPAERAVLRLVEGLAAVALIGAATACAQYLSGHPGVSSVDWQMVLRVCVAGAAVAVLMALAKYFRAHGDPALGDALAAVGAQVASANQIGMGSATEAAPSVAQVAAQAPGGAGAGTSGALG